MTMSQIGYGIAGTSDEKRKMGDDGTEWLSELYSEDLRFIVGPARDFWQFSLGIG
jgi:hypothetical protein